MLHHRNGTSPTLTPAGQPPAEPPPAPAAPPRTEFGPDRPVDSSRAFLYHLARRQMAGLPLIRWLYVLLCALPLAVLLLPPPWPWLGVGGPLLLIALWLSEWTARRNSYVRFTPRPAPPVTPQPLPPGAKLPVYVSGLLAVENKARRFAGLPGFYRTFGTREHALLCRVRPRSFAGLGGWPEDEVGLWYAFFRAGHVHSLCTGEIAFDRHSLPGLAIDYTPPQPLGPKKRRRPQRLTLYIAFLDSAGLHTALADLAVESLTVYSSPETHQS